MFTHRRTYSMDTDQLDYLEKRGLAAPQRRSSGFDSSRPQQPRQYSYHSQLSGEGLFGISAYGLIILCFLLFASLFFYGIVHGFWHICTHYATPAKQNQLLH